MSKATATCMCATCGKEFTVTAFRRNTSEARSFEKWAAAHIDECDDCKGRRIAATRQEAAENALCEAKEKRWPDLQGSDKQVAWALRIRSEMTSKMIEDYPEDREIVIIAIDRFVAEHTSAAWWIDNRDSWRAFAKPVLVLAREIAMHGESVEPAEEDEDETTIVEPENRIHEGIVDIKAADDRVSAFYRKDDSFRSIVKSLSYRWCGETSSWGLDIGPRTGSAKERAAELGNKLLNAGFSVRIQDQEIRQNAIEGKYEPMSFRWISKRGADKFFVTWARNDSFYDKAKSLPGAKYSSPGIEVPSREYEAVSDFAHTYGFKLTEGAKSLVDSMKRQSCVAIPAAQTNPEYQESPLADILNSSSEIIPDLKD